MGLDGVVSEGTCRDAVGSCMLHVREDSGGGGGEVFEGFCDGNARVANGEDDDLQPSPVFLEGRGEGGVFLGFSPILASQPK